MAVVSFKRETDEARAAATETTYNERQDSMTKTTTEPTQTTTIENPHHEADRAWLAGQHPENLRRIARTLRVCPLADDTAAEIREKLLAELDIRRARDAKSNHDIPRLGHILDFRCPVCRAPVAIQAFFDQTAAEAKGNIHTERIECFGASRHRFPRSMPWPRT